MVKIFKKIKSRLLFDEQSIIPYKGGSNDNKTDDIIASQNILRVSVEKLSFYTTRLTYVLIIIGVIQLVLLFLK